MQLLLEALPPTHEVISHWGWKPNANEFGPDVMVVPLNDDEVRFTGIPALAVEVLFSNRSDDLIWKCHRYAQAGLPHYWIVDLRDRVRTRARTQRWRLRPAHPRHSGRACVAEPRRQPRPDRS